MMYADNVNSTTPFSLVQQNDMCLRAVILITPSTVSGKSRGRCGFINSFDLRSGFGFKNSIAETTRQKANKNRASI